MSPVRVPLMIPAGRRQAHRRVEAFAIANRRDRRAVAEMRDDQLRRHIGLQLVDDRLVRNAVIAVATHAHRRVFRRESAYAWPPRAWCDESMCRGSRSWARRETGLQRLAHDVNGDGRMQRRERLVAVDLIDQLGRDELVLIHRRPAAHRAMPDRRRGRELAGVQRIRNQLECHRAAGQGRRLDPPACLPLASLIQNLPRSVPMPSTAPSKSRARSPLPASYTENLMEEEPLFKTKTGNDDMDE